MEEVIRIGIDTSKYVFQLHGVNAAEQPVLRKKMRCREMIDLPRRKRNDGAAVTTVTICEFERRLCSWR